MNERLANLYTLVAKDGERLLDLLEDLAGIRGGPLLYEGSRVLEYQLSREDYEWLREALRASSEV